jgi:hypothetical protein
MRHVGEIVGVPVSPPRFASPFRPNELEVKCPE